MPFLLNLGSFLTGIVFGISLLISSSSDRDVMLSQFSGPLGNSQSIQIFLSASVISSIIVYTANRTSYAKLSHRTNSSYGWFGPFDANIVGGALQGVGMALSGADPGTALVQLASGTPNTGWLILGGILGALVFVLFGSRLKSSNAVGNKNNAAQSSISSTHTLPQYFKVSIKSAISFYAVSITVVLIASQYHATRSYTPSHVKPTSSLNPILGGVLIGSVQGISILITRKTLGISSAYQDVASYVVTLLKRITSTKSAPSTLAATQPNLSNIVFAVGIMYGTKVVLYALNSSVAPPTIPAATVAVSPSAALVGGFSTIFGARLAGGCTSGHGLSGTSTLSFSSFVTMASLFSAGIMFRQVFKLV